MKNLKKISRIELKEIIGGKLPGGGGGSCSMVVTGGVWTSSVTEVRTFTGSCSSQSSQANSHCVDMLAGPLGGGGARCHYDCSCDGVG